MKNIFAVITTLLIIAVSTTSMARDTKHMFPLSEALESEAFKEKLDSDIKLIFGDTKYSEPTKKLGTFSTNKKTNAFNKTDSEACEWALLSALLKLQDRARSEGGNAIVNIESFYKKNPVSSETEYECHAGALMAGVALRGTVVKID